MKRTLPPLNALRAFEASARLLSFTKAAQELGVTQAAISHQVKALEAWLGIPLFRRQNRQVLLTDSGQTYFQEVRKALDHLAVGTDRLLKRDHAGVLTVSTLISFAAKWLVPRLGRFRLRHPEIDVRIAAGDHLVDFESEDVDIAIRYGRGQWSGLHVDRLFGEEIFAVCSPLLLEGPCPLRVPSDLRHHTLLHDTMREDWQMWLGAAGLSDIDPSRGYSFSHSDMLLQAAIDGHGVALGRSVLVADDLAAGRLMKPFDLSLTAESAYYVACPESTAKRPKIVVFRDWLLAESAGAP